VNIKNEKINGIILLIKAVSLKFRRDRIFVYAAQASFFIAISTIPFLMLLISVLRFFLPVNAAEAAEAINKLIPSRLYPYAEAVISELFGSTGISMISFTAAALIWAASRGVKSVGQGIRNVYKTEYKVGFFKNIFLSLLYTLILVIILAAIITILIFGRYLSGFEAPEGIATLLCGIASAFRGMVPVVVLSIVFTAVFKALASHHMALKYQLPGSIFAAFGWNLFSFFYSVYIDNFSDYSYIYGSLAAVVLLLLWVYFCMTILLIGAEINVLTYELAMTAAEIRNNK